MDAKIAARIAYCALAVSIIMVLAGCTGPAVGNLCTAGPIITDDGADTRLTISEKQQLVTLNNAGRSICGWRSLS